ncbi:MAG: leucine-rich repeat protein [Clostridia bacterium]|nr:leucine-rich repeat protein [Clostridia bacterium]
MKNKKSYIISLLAIAVIIFIVTAGLTGCKKHIKYDDSYDFAVREGCSDFYYSHLSENQQKMYRMLHKEAEDVLYNGQEKDNLGIYKFSDYGLSFEEAETVWYAFRYDASAFFIISNSFTYNSSSMTVKIAPEFLDKSVKEKVLEEVQNSVEEVKQLLDGIEGSALKFKIIYDYVIAHTKYAVDEKGKILFNGYSYSMAGVLDRNDDTKSICQGYVHAVKYLCNIFGVECLYVGSEAKEHAVNIVNVDGEWYYADATLDDTEEEYYKYFLEMDDLRWEDLSRPYENASENYLRSCLPKLKDGYSNPYYFYGSRNGDFYCSINKKRGDYTCEISGCVEGVENVTIPKYIGVYEITSFAFWNCTSLKSVIVPDGFTNSGSYSNCDNLTNVELPQTVTELGSFYECRSLKNINIPSGVTRIPSNAFKGCSNLTNVNIPSGVTVIENYAFEGCSSLESIEIPSGVITIGERAFYGCSSLKSIDIPDTVYRIGRYDDLSGRYYSSTFSNCTSLEYIKLPIWLDCIGTNMFSGCSSLTGIIIPFGIVRICADAFKDCDKLTIYCEASEKGELWVDDWNCSCPVEWGYKAS